MTRIVLLLSILLIMLVLLRFSCRSFEGFESSKSVVICKAEWCGHCKDAKPEFDKLLGMSPITLKDGSKATVKVLDADKDKSELSQFEVKGFPTILIMNNGKSSEYPGPRSSEKIIEYLNSQ
jgi:thiol-disulfide isomerase/thioredoxin